MNMNINYTSLVNFRKHFNTNITRPIEIKNSKIFYINKNDDVSTISPVRKIDYKIDFKSKEKKLKILGKLFDSEYNFELIKNYSNPYKTNLNINFKNPNIRIENNTIKSAEKEFDEGKIKVTFMTNESKYNYKFNNKEINFFKFGKDQSNFNFEGKINLDPFYFNTVMTFKKQNFNLILDKLLFNFYNYKESINQNFNGNLNIKFEDIQNNFLKSGLINISFTDSRINLVNNTFNINKIGTLNLKENKFVEIEDKLYFKSSIQIKIENQDEFYRKFSIPKKNRINLKNIFFVLEKDVDNENYYISNIKVNSSDEIKNLDDQKSNYEKIKISNIQQLRKVSQNVFESLN